jgi:dienelactone hydrolase
MKPNLPLVVAVLSFLIPTAFSLAEPAPTWGSLTRGSYAVGFRLLEETDASRAIRSGKGAHPRPVRVYLWYPAVKPEEAGPMTFGRYAAMADEDVWPEARGTMAYERRAFARSLGDRYPVFLERTMAAFENAKPVGGRFPLIVVGQGLYYESPVTHAALCEYLAGHGFVVATCPLVGTHSPLVHLDVEDLETQVRDMEFVIGRAAELPFVDADKLGLFGFDMGGMSCVILAMRNPQVVAFASVDAGIQFTHPAGIPHTSPYWDPEMLRIPWLHGTSDRFATAPQGYEGPNLFEDARHAERFLLRTEGMGHADYTSYALVEERDPIPLYWGPRQGGEKERYEAVVRYVTSFFKAFVEENPIGLHVMHQEPEAVFPGLGFKLDRKAALPVHPVYSDFLNALMARDPDRALEIAADLREHRPDSPIHEERVLNRLGYHMLMSWDLPGESIVVFRINTEIHPQSANVWDSLGEAYWRSGDNENALKCIRKVLEIDPENERALDIRKQLLEAIGS